MIPEGSGEVVETWEQRNSPAQAGEVTPAPSRSQPAASPLAATPVTLPQASAQWPPPNSEVAAQPRPDLELRPGQPALDRPPVEYSNPATSLHNQFKDLNEYPSTVKELMTRGVVTVTPQHTAPEALEVLCEHDFHHLPVVDAEERLVGLVSDHDLLGRDGSLGDRMITKVLTATPDTGVREATEALVKEKFHSLVVVDPEGRPIGMITSFDVLRYLVDHPAMKLWQP